MVWVAVGATDIVGPFFIGGNVDADQYLRLLEEEFYPAFCSFGNSSELFFMQDGLQLTGHCMFVSGWMKNSLTGRSEEVNLVTATSRDRPILQTSLPWILAFGA